MRLFSAIGVPDDVAQTLSLFCGGLHDAKWVEPEDYHVTLAFYGELAGPVANELAQALSEIAMPLFALRVTGLGIFGSAKPHALVALVEKTPPLLALEAAHRATFARLGIAGETRKYTPHVTLARLRGTTAGEVAVWMSQQSAFRPCAWHAESFALYSSRTSRGGGPYVAEVEFALTGKA